MKCDNCGKNATHLVRHILDGAVLHDCHECYKVNTHAGGGEWTIGIEPIHQTPTIRCKCCNRRAPRKVVKAHPMPGNLLGLRIAEQNDLNGWMLAVMPYRDIYLNPRREGTINERFGVSWSEVIKICPTCAMKVAGTMNHLSTPMLGEEDL